MPKILILFFNTLAANDKFSIRNSENFRQPIQMQLCNEQKNSAFLADFGKSTLHFQHFETKMTLIANVFRKLRTSKDVVR